MVLSSRREHVYYKVYFAQILGYSLAYRCIPPAPPLLSHGRPYTPLRTCPEIYTISIISLAAAEIYVTPAWSAVLYPTGIDDNLPQRIMKHIGSAYT
jgi:hypothetical protein